MSYIHRKCKLLLSRYERCPRLFYGLSIRLRGGAVGKIDPTYTGRFCQKIGFFEQRRRVWGSSRYGVFTKSPQTGAYAESYSGGKAPEAIDAVGFDAIIISGRRENPTALEITLDAVYSKMAKSADRGAALDYGVSAPKQDKV